MGCSSLKTPSPRYLSGGLSRFRIDGTKIIKESGYATPQRKFFFQWRVAHYFFSTYVDSFSDPTFGCCGCDNPVIEGFCQAFPQLVQESDPCCLFTIYVPLKYFMRCWVVDSYHGVIVFCVHQRYERVLKRNVTTYTLVNYFFIPCGKLQVP